ncbi:PREDICTED: thioredoxin H-type 1-like [Nelumbo nucifera]|uniref:Thioredoxin domain-containing protein n=2 Tax=Nelumbo nucifera TaxID=4432 RepID=A0A822ZLH1_NELNU|nr:PREDICTED: thioredoxin H-type 1-like [Nelumbo nucifera]DAD43826.1 TPA_asm: hypothetical protein HUJ06_002056 [Nelumbo nucifera]
MQFSLQMGHVNSCSSEKYWNQYVKGSQKPVLVYFYLSYSGRSEQFYTDVADLARKHPNVNFFKVDVELLKSIAKAYDVNGTACVLLMPNENKELVVRGKFSKMDKEELEKFLKSHL